jgi:hypothetical protein
MLPSTAGNDVLCSLAYKDSVAVNTNSLDKYFFTNCRQKPKRTLKGKVSL